MRYNCIFEVNYNSLFNMKTIITRIFCADLSEINFNLEQQYVRKGQLGISANDPERGQGFKFRCM